MTSFLQESQPVPASPVYRAGPRRTKARPPVLQRTSRTQAASTTAMAIDAIIMEFGSMPDLPQGLQDLKQSIGQAQDEQDWLIVIQTLLKPLILYINLNRGHGIQPARKADGTCRRSSDQIVSSFTSWPPGRWPCPSSIEEDSHEANGLEGSDSIPGKREKTKKVRFDRQYVVNIYVEPELDESEAASDERPRLID